MAFQFLLRSRNLHAANDITTVDIDGLQCKILDDGGGQLEPHEWIHRFRDLDAIIYVVSLPGYCQTTQCHPPTVYNPASSSQSY